MEEPGFGVQGLGPGLGTNNVGFGGPRIWCGIDFALATEDFSLQDSGFI